jgi:hypothetical protein
LSAFEYVFAFYSLLLGLAVANVVTGFADMWRERHVVAVGVCTPLIAGIVLLGVMNIWLRFWPYQDTQVLTPWQLISLVALATPYIFISRALFPVGGAGIGLEDHYLAHRRTILLALAVPPAVATIRTATLLGGLAPDWNLLWTICLFAAPVVLMLFPGRQTNRAGLALITVWMIVGLFR